MIKTLIFDFTMIVISGVT